MIIFVLCKACKSARGEARGSGQATSWLPTWLGTKWGKLGLTWLDFDLIAYTRYLTGKLGASSNNGWFQTVAVN